MAYENAVWFMRSNLHTKLSLQERYYSRSSPSSMTLISEHQCTCYQRATLIKIQRHHLWTRTTKEDLSYGSFSLCHCVAAKVACDSLHQYLHRHSSCDLAITHSGDPLSFGICQLSAWDSRENYRRFLENYKGQQKGGFDLFLFSL